MSDLSHEPSPGDRLEAGDFARIVRLTPLVSIDLIVRNRQNRVLVGRRTSEPARGVFFVPGGRITKNESRADAFRRLCQIELGRSFEPGDARFLGVFDHIYPTNALGLPGFGTHYVVLAYELPWPFDSDELPATQHDEYLWLTEAEIIRRADVHENTRAYFRNPAG